MTLLTLTFVSLAYTRLHITDEQEEFIQRILEIPLEDRKCRDLITLDTLHLYCGGPESSAAARRLEEFARRREWTFIRPVNFSPPSLALIVFLCCRDGICEAEDKGCRSSSEGREEG